LNIAVAPEIKSLEQSVIVLEGQTLTIPCEATGRPNPLITWTAPYNKESTNSNDITPVYQKLKKNKSDVLCLQKT